MGQKLIISTFAITSSDVKKINANVPHSGDLRITHLLVAYHICIIIVTLTPDPCFADEHP